MGGEYGAALFTSKNYFAIPACPLESVYDPTGAGDTFAGGFMGYLAAQERTDAAALRRALVYGSGMASVTLADFSLRRFKRLRPAHNPGRDAGLLQPVKVEALADETPP